MRGSLRGSPSIGFRLTRRSTPGVDLTIVALLAILMTISSAIRNPVAEEVAVPILVATALEEDFRFRVLAIIGSIDMR